MKPPLFNTFQTKLPVYIDLIGCSDCWLHPVKTVTKTAKGE